MSKETGGPAFPRPASEAHQHGMHSPQEGMTLRDYFAAKAMQKILYSERMMGIIGVNIYENRCAEDAYKMADAMLKAREQ